MKSRYLSSCYPHSFSDAWWAQGCCIQKNGLNISGIGSERFAKAIEAHSQLQKGFAQYIATGPALFFRGQLDHWKAYPFCYETWFLRQLFSLGKSCLASHEYIKCISHAIVEVNVAAPAVSHSRFTKDPSILQLQWLIDCVERSIHWAILHCQLTLYGYRYTAQTSSSSSPSPQNFK